MRGSFAVPLALALCVGAVSSALAQPNGVAGAVFAMTNATDPGQGNEILVYDRMEDGSLVLSSTVPTGGLGSGPAPTSTVFGINIAATADGIGSQDSLILSDDRRYLFAVNAGSDSVTCFRVRSNAFGTRLSDPVTVDSGGVFPASLAFSNRGAGMGVLYVLNAGEEGTVAGFRVLGNCQMSPLSSELLSLEGLINDPPFPDPAPNEVLTTPADIGFTPDGTQLVVAIKGGPDGNGGGFEGGIVVYELIPTNGGLRAVSPTVTEFSGADGRAGPFSFTFDRYGHLLLNHANSFSFASYDISDTGELIPIGEPVAISALGDDASNLAFGGFNCWVVIYKNFVYVMTFGDIPATSGGLPDGSGVITALTVDRDGNLSLLPTTAVGDPGVVAVLPQDDRDDPNAQTVGNHGIDMAVVENGDSAFLYAIQPRLGQIGIWEINDDGTLTATDTTTAGLTPGVDPFAGTNPGINDFLERCYLQDAPRSPECSQGSAQGIQGF